MGRHEVKLCSALHAVFMLLNDTEVIRHPCPITCLSYLMLKTDTSNLLNDYASLFVA